MTSKYSVSIDLDAITRNLTALDLAYLSPEECADYEHELSAIASLNEALESAAAALEASHSPQFWQRLYPLLSNAVALLSSQLAPLLDRNAERSLSLSEHFVEHPLALVAHVSQI